ncbi:DNA cytosine methyltransferase (plasmid) [Ornithinimicrobium sp. INDO-MA30-4]|nr:DNA cytosine methyltransferase [Ornithinimicrobium sp. INDO-MA30-4]
MRETEPQWVLLENVPNLLALHAGAGMRHVIEQLDDLGYRWAYRTVDSRFTGVPQRRPRVIILASRDHDPSTVLLGQDAGPRAEDPHPDQPRGFYWTEGRNGLGLVAGAIPTLKGDQPWGCPLRLPSGSQPVNSGDAWSCRESKTAKLSRTAPGWTAPAVVEGERDLRWKLVGNAVTVGVGQWLGERLAHSDSLVSIAPPASDVVIRRDRRWPSRVGISGWRVRIDSLAMATAGTDDRTRRHRQDPNRIVAPGHHRVLVPRRRVLPRPTGAIPPRPRAAPTKHATTLEAASWASSDASKRRMQTQRQKTPNQKWLSADCCTAAACASGCKSGPIP